MKCRFPIQITCKGRQIYVPCGKCAWCLSRIRDEWVFRMKKESKDHVFSSFVTLTYRDEDLPYSINEETGEMVNSVSLRDIQLFHKSLHKKLEFKHVLCSEYGPQTLRPHYHGIYFHDKPFDIAGFWPYGDNNTQYPAKVTSFKYVLKYMLKGSNVPPGAEPNFKTVSRRPGIGSTFNYKGDEYILTENGVKSCVPRYYSRRYLGSLDARMRDYLSDVKLDYLHEQDRHQRFHEVYDRLYAEGSITSDFETWLSDLYRQDYVKQVKINNKK